MLEKLMGSPIAWAILSIITILSLVLAIIFYLKGKEKKEFSYCLRSSSLIRKNKRKFEKLSVVYDGQAVDDLCVSKFTIWNSGNKTLGREDMVATKELTITASKKNRILDVELIACTEETNKFSATIVDEHTVKVLFDYVDKREGAVVQILHTGTDDTLGIDCKIKGGAPIRNFVNEKVPRMIFRIVPKRWVMKSFPVMFVSMLMLLLIIAVIETAKAFGIDVKSMLFDPKAGTDVPDMASKKATTASIAAGISWLYFWGYLMLGIPAMKLTMKIGIPSKLKRYSSFDY